MMTTEIAALANNAAQMIQNDQSLSTVTERVRNEVSKSLASEPLTVEDIEGQVRHVINCAFKVVARDYAD